MQHLGNVKYKNRNREDVSPNVEREGLGTPVPYIESYSYRLTTQQKISDYSKSVSNVCGSKEFLR